MEAKVEPQGFGGHDFDQELQMGNGSAKESGVLDMGEEKVSGGGAAKAFLNKAIWHGGSVYDAWLNAVSAQVRIQDHLTFLLPGPHDWQRVPCFTADDSRISSFQHAVSSLQGEPQNISN